MKTAGLIFTMIVSVFGGVLCFFDLWSETAALTALFAVIFTAIQFFLSILGFFKPVGAGIAIMATSFVMIVAAIATSAKFTLSVETLMLGCGYLVMYGGRKGA